MSVHGVLFLSITEDLFVESLFQPLLWDMTAIRYPSNAWASGTAAAHPSSHFRLWSKEYVIATFSLHKLKLWLFSSKLQTPSTKATICVSQTMNTTAAIVPRENADNLVSTKTSNAFCWKCKYLAKSRRTFKFQVQQKACSNNVNSNVGSDPGSSTASIFCR